MLVKSKRIIQDISDQDANLYICADAFMVLHSKTELTISDYINVLKNNNAFFKDFHENIFPDGKYRKNSLVTNKGRIYYGYNNILSIVRNGN